MYTKAFLSGNRAEEGEEGSCVGSGDVEKVSGRGLECA